ncbi:MAG: four helix bundle protein [Lewinellaceae bacterium]|nr:four helix bundle protein [Lewinellaceae bacterium]
MQPQFLRPPIPSPFKLAPNAILFRKTPPLPPKGKWQKSRSLVNRIYKATKAFPREERYSLTNPTKAFGPPKR